MLKKALSIILVLVLSLSTAAVTAVAAGVDIALNKTAYTPNEDIKISITGITDKMTKAGAFVGLYASGAAYDKALKQITLKAVSSTVTIKAPAAGKYEIRVYRRGAPCLKKVAFTVGTSAVTLPPKPTSTPAPTPTPELPLNNSPIIGMWRSDFYGGLHASFGVVFFDADGSYKAIRYNTNRFIGAKGKYKLSGNTLEIYDNYVFEKHNDAAALSDQWTEDYNELFDIILRGTKTEVLEIINPNHSLYRTYTGGSAAVGWVESESWAETIEWIDATTIDYNSGIHYPLKLVP